MRRRTVRTFTTFVSLATLSLSVLGCHTTDSGACTVAKRGDWELHVFYRSRGTKSEGRHGVLVHKGNVVLGGQTGETLQTDLGPMKYFGRTPENPWSTTGWYFANRSDARRFLER